MSGIVLTPDTILPISSQPLKESSVAVCDGKIIDVDKTDTIKSRYSDFKFTDKKNTIILPGFINAHTHLELGWTKNRIKNCSSFINWLEQLISAKSQDIKKSQIIGSVERGINELINSGVTTVGEISSYGGLDIDFLKNAGLRTILFKEIVDSNSESLDSMSFDRAEIYEERPFPHAPYSCNPDLLEKVFEIAGKQNIPLGIHLAESIDEVNFIRKEDNGFEKVIYPMIGKLSFKRKKADSPLKYISRFLKNRNVSLSAVHMVQIDREDVDILNKHDIAVILCPRSNILLKVGKPKLELIKDIKRTGLATDGLSSNLNLNFFDELSEVNTILAEKNIKDNFYLSLYFATLGGARSLFIDDRVGSIEKGKDADLICLNYDNKMLDPYEAVVKSAKENLEFSMVRGNYIFNKSISG